MTLAYSVEHEDEVLALSYSALLALLVGLHFSFSHDLSHFVAIAIAAWFLLVQRWAQIIPW